MAIKIKKPAKIRATREFTDRLEPRKAFWNRYSKMVSDGSTLITFYGAGGVGKTALLKKLMSEIDQKRQMMQENIAYVHYDFDNNCDVRTIIKILKTQLEKYGCPFPLFETGNFYYELKIGNKGMDSPEIKSIMDRSPYLSKIKNGWEDLGTIADYMIPGIRAITTAMDVLDKELVKFLKSHGMFDEDHEDLKYKLGAMRMSNNPNELYEFLPILFSQDVADWLTDEKADKERTLVIFLDTYEALVNEAVAVKTQRDRDLWLRDEDNGIINFIPNTLWVIAGRNKVRWTGDLAEELDQHLITALSDEDSNYFLKQAGVESAELRDGIVKHTQGLPIYLDLCVDVYERYRQRNGTEPDISEFGEHRQEVLDRLIKYMDAGTQDMIYFLSILNTWTDDIAKEIGSKALPNFSVATYNQTKYFSFIVKDKFSVDDFSVTTYTFDKTVQSVIFPSCDEFIIKKTKDIANEYFNAVLNNSDNYAQSVYYLKLWAELIVRLTDDMDDLLKQYEDNIADYVYSLSDDVADFDAAKNIVKLFFDKVSSYGDENTISYAYFERKFGSVERSEGKYQEAYEHINSAYNKCLNLLGDKHPDTIMAMNNLAITLNDLGRYEEALQLNEQVLKLRKEILGDEHPDTIMAMNNLAITLGDLGRYEEALQLNEQVLKLRKEILGDRHLDTIGAMYNLASTLNNLGYYKEALKFKEQVLSLRKEILGDEHPDTITAMNNIAITLNYLGRYEEALTLNEQVLELQKNILGDKHPNTIGAMSNLALTLNDLGRYEEASTLNEQVLELRKEILGDKHPTTIDAMENLALTLNSLGRYDEALKLNEQVLLLSKELLGDEHPYTVVAMNDLAVTLDALGRYEEALKLNEQVLSLSRDILGDKHPDTINAMGNLANTLDALGRYEEALKLNKQVLELQKDTLGDEHPATIGAMNNLSLTLKDLGRYEEALKLKEQVLSLRKEILGYKHIDTLTAMDSLADLYFNLNRYEEALKIYEQLIPLSSEVFGEKDETTIDSMYRMAFCLGYLRRYEEVLPLCQQVLALYKETLGDRDENTINAMDTLAVTLYYLERYEEALPIYERVVELRRELFGNNDPNAINDLDNLADTLCKLNRYEEALLLREEVASLRKEVLGEEDKDTLEATYNLACTLGELGRYDEALALFEQLISLSNKIFADDPSTLNSILEELDSAKVKYAKPND